MKLKNIFSPLVLLLLFSIGCQNKKALKSKEAKTSKTIVDTHDSEFSIDWDGTYFGMLPCESCLGISRMITLHNDGTFIEMTEHLNSGQKPIVKEGQFQWNENKRVIACNENFYLVGEDVLYFLQKGSGTKQDKLDKKPMLYKVDLKLTQSTKEGYTFEKYRGSDKKEYNVLFITSTKVPTVYIQSQGFKRILSQTQAWAKGAEYFGSNISLVAKNKTLLLSIDQKSIQLRPIK